MKRHAIKQKLAKNVNEIYGILLPSHTKEMRARSFAGKSRTAEINKTFPIPVKISRNAGENSVDRA